MSEQSPWRRATTKLVPAVAALALAAGCSNSGSEKKGLNDTFPTPNTAPLPSVIMPPAPHETYRTPSGCAYRVLNKVMLSTSDMESIKAHPKTLLPKIDTLKKLSVAYDGLKYNAPGSLYLSQYEPSLSTESRQHNKDEADLDINALTVTSIQILGHTNKLVGEGYDITVPDGTVEILAVKFNDPNCNPTASSGPNGLSQSSTI